VVDCCGGADSAILTPTPLEELKSSKAFHKAMAKRDKELEGMRRKHEKVGGNRGRLELHSGGKASWKSVRLCDWRF
jgi:hypothetical protein